MILNRHVINKTLIDQFNNYRRKILPVKLINQPPDFRPGMREYRPMVVQLNKKCSYKSESYQRKSISFSSTIKNLEDLSGTQSMLNKKPRSNRKRRSIEQDSNGYFKVFAYATAEEYDLEKLSEALKEQDLYEPKKLKTEQSVFAGEDVLFVTAKYLVDNEPRDILFFREGSVVLWNCNELECSNVLLFLQQYQIGSYDKTIVRSECEFMNYNFVSEDSSSGARAMFRNGKFYLSGSENHLEKYTFSNALISSVRLGIWETTLDRYILSMAYVTNDLKAGRPIKMSRAEVLKKTGELFALRHLINLSSDLLDTPDFYWDREQLEDLYSRTCSYFSVQRRTKVINEKLNHCVELADLVSSNLNDKHHIRLEWMIIILIMVEVGFEILHYIDRYYERIENEKDYQTEYLPLPTNDLPMPKIKRQIEI